MPFDRAFLERYYLFTDQELKLIRQHKGSANQLGFAVQLGYLHLPGRVLEVGEQPPPELIEFVAVQLKVAPGAFENYSRDRPSTRREHLQELYEHSGFIQFKEEHYQTFKVWLGEK